MLEYRVKICGKWFAVPVSIIEADYAAYYANVDNVSLEDALQEVCDRFKANHYEIRDWASNNMDWSDVRHVAQKIKNANETQEDEDAQEDWINGSYEIVET